MILKALSSINTTLKVALGEGSYSLDPIHLDLIRAVSETLNPSVSKLIDRQIGRANYVEWMSGGRVNRVFFTNLGENEVIGSPDFQDALFRCKVRLENRTRTCNVVFYKGRLLDVEIPLARKHWRGRAYEILSCARSDPKSSHTHAIDRLEHGRTSES